MIVQHNIEAMNAERALDINGKSKLKCLEKLSSGYKVNRAADNAAGLAVSEEMRAQIRGLNQAARNVDDGIGYVQVAEGALSEIQDMMHRIHELAVQAANDTNTPEDRECIDTEIQMLKEEMDYIFRETEYNTIKIWEAKSTADKILIGTEKVQALRITSSTDTFRITEKNKGAIAYNGYTIEVQGTNKDDPDNYGFKITWEGWNQKKYSTELISWNDMGETSFSTRLSKHIDLAKYPELDGVDFPISWTHEKRATLEDIAKAVDGVRYSSTETASEQVSVKAANGVGFSVSIGYLAELASGRNMDAYDTDWIEPAVSGSTNVTKQPSYINPQENTGWEIQFTMPGIGRVTATSSSIYYYSGDRDTKSEGLWWEWVYPTNSPRYQSGLIHYPDRGSSGSLLGVTDCLTDSGGNGDSLTANTKTGGTIVVTFNMQANSSFNYEGRTGTSVGSITMTISVGTNDTEETIMNRIKSQLNTNTIFDVYEGNESTGAPQTGTGYAYSASARTSTIEIPVYGTVYDEIVEVDRVIQDGANARELIHIRYDTLRVSRLGIADSNVLTREAASRAITKIQAASEMISEQRSLFGAYQNQMEHAKASDKNTAENLQASESRVRDTDMAEEMMNNARISILEQTTQAMLANANRKNEGILALLQ